MGLKPTASSIVRVASNWPFGSGMYARVVLDGYQNSNERSSGATPDSAMSALAASGS